MTDFSAIRQQLETRLAEILARTDAIEEDLRHPLDEDFSEQAIDLADDEALEGVDDVLHAEARQIRLALTRIDNGSYGTCANCGVEIATDRLAALPFATRCLACAA